MGHVHRPWNSCHSVRYCEQGWLKKNKDVGAANFDVHRPLKTAFFDPPYHPEWKTTQLGNKLVTSTTDDFRQYAQASSWDTHRPYNKGSTPWAHNAYPRAAYTTCSGMSSSFRQ